MRVKVLKEKIGNDLIQGIIDIANNEQIVNKKEVIRDAIFTALTGKQLLKADDLDNVFGGVRLSQMSVGDFYYSEYSHKVLLVFAPCRFISAKGEVFVPYATECNDFRQATSKEIAEFISEMEKNGLSWDAEKKTLNAKEGFRRCTSDEEINDDFHNVVGKLFKESVKDLSRYDGLKKIWACIVVEDSIQRISTTRVNGGFTIFETLGFCEKLKKDILTQDDNEKLAKKN